MVICYLYVKEVVGEVIVKVLDELKLPMRVCQLAILFSMTC